MLINCSETVWFVIFDCWFDWSGVTVANSCYHYEQYYRKISILHIDGIYVFTFLFVFDNFFCNFIWIYVILCLWLFIENEVS